MKRPLSLMPLITILFIGPVMLAGATELFKTTLIWHFRIVDFIDLVVTAPLYLILLASLSEYLHRNQAPGVIRISFMISAGVFLYGHALHVSSNAINTYSTEIHHYQSVIPADTYELIYFLDETLSHILSFMALYGVLISLLIFEGRYSKITGAENQRWFALAIGALYGVGQGIAFVEGQKVLLCLILVLGSTGVLVWLSKLAGTSFWLYARRGPMSMIFVGLLPATLLTLGCYLVMFGGFVQPSTLGY